MSESQPTAYRDAIVDAAVREAGRTPAVRGADFQYATVTAVNTDGTVSIGEIRARRHTSYTVPAAGDTVVIAQSGNRNWICLGRLAGAESGSWTTLTLASGYINPGHGYTAAWLRDGKRVWLRGRIGPSAGGSTTISSGATIATLPASIRPAGATEVGWASPRNQISTAPSLTRCEITPAGVLRIFDGSTLPQWISLDGVSYTTD